MNTQILTINPKADSTKVAVYINEQITFLKTIKHKESVLKKEVIKQLEERKNDILEELANNHIALKDLKLIMSRGGLLKPVESGVYEINEAMKEDLRKGYSGVHASNLGGLISDELAKIAGCKAYIADPAVIDEFGDFARVSGHPDFKRKSIFHALSQKSVAQKYAKSQNYSYEELNLIIVSIRMGVSVGAHRKGRVIDVSQAFDGNGPFSMERSGSLPPGDLVKACFSGKYTQQELEDILTCKGGMYAYLGTTNHLEIGQRIEDGDEKAAFYFEAMAYQVAKEIGAMYTVLEGNVDAIIFSGDIFYNEKYTEFISKRVNRIAPIVVYPHEFQMDALARNGMNLLRGETEPKEYK